MRIHPVLHVTLLKPAIPDPFPERNMGPPEPGLSDGEEEYKVKEIMECRRRRKETQYMIKWQGYGPEENLWDPENNVLEEEVRQRVLTHMHMCRNANACAHT